MRGLMTRKSCAVGMRNAILRNYLNKALLLEQVGLEKLWINVDFKVIEILNWES